MRGATGGKMMTAPKMTVPPTEGATPFAKFENALKVVLRAPKPAKKDGKRKPADK